MNTYYGELISSCWGAGGGGAGQQGRGAGVLGVGLEGVETKPPTVNVFRPPPGFMDSAGPKDSSEAQLKDQDPQARTPFSPLPHQFPESLMELMWQSKSLTVLPDVILRLCGMAVFINMLKGLSALSIPDRLPAMSMLRLRRNESPKYPLLSYFHACT